MMKMNMEMMMMMMEYYSYQVNHDADRHIEDANKAHLKTKVCEVQRSLVPSHYQSFTLKTKMNFYLKLDLTS